MKTKEEILETKFDCGKCNQPNGIKFTETVSKNWHTFKVDKCSKCKHQYGIKELENEIKDRNNRG